jgi:hypothetical protein
MRPERNAFNPPFMSALRPCSFRWIPTSTWTALQQDEAELVNLKFLHRVA